MDKSKTLDYSEVASCQSSCKFYSTSVASAENWHLEEPTFKPGMTGAVCSRGVTPKYLLTGADVLLTVTDIIWLQIFPQNVFRYIIIISRYHHFFQTCISFVFVFMILLNPKVSFSVNFWFISCFVKFFSCSVWVFLSLTEAYQQFCLCV